MGIYIQETWVNRSGGHMIGENEPYETWCETVGELFRAMQQEYGRCISKMYVDKRDTSEPLQVGWVFEQKDKYTDCNEEYLRETWVYVYKEKPALVPRHFVGEGWEF
jgi:hypothetical protein